MQQQRQVLTPGPAELRGLTKSANPTGSELIRAAATLGKKNKAHIVVISDAVFSTSSYGYSGKAVLVDTTINPVKAHDSLVGPGSINVPGNPYAVLRPKLVKEYLQD